MLPPGPMGTRLAAGVSEAHGRVAGLAFAAGYAHPALPIAEQLADVEKAGPVRPEMDVDPRVQARVPAGPYHLVSGDVLELGTPQISRVASRHPFPQAACIEPTDCRVDPGGGIELPVVGRLPAAGKMPGEVEPDVVTACFPRHVACRMCTCLCNATE